MFFYLLVAVLASATVHAVLIRGRGRAHIGELYLRYVLAGYCGLPLLLVALAVLVWPAATAAHFGLGDGGSPMEAMLGFAMLGMSAAALLAAWLRGRYLIGPTLAWAVFWLGATTVHLGGRDHVILHGEMLHVLASHALVGIILVVALAVGRRRVFE